MCPALPNNVNVSSDDSQLAPLIEKADTAGSSSQPEASSSDQLMSSPTRGPYQKLYSSSLPSSSPQQIQKTLSDRSCMVFLYIFA